MFIGEPNTGKTNILEALSLWCPECTRAVKKFFRAALPADFHWDQDLANPIELSLDDQALYFSTGTSGTDITYKKGERKTANYARIENDLHMSSRGVSTITRVYSFNESVEKNVHGDSDLSLAPPYGENIVDLLYSNKEARLSSAQFFQGTGFRLNVDFTAKRLLLTKEVDDTLISFPYSTSSETLRRMVFYHLALDTNKDQTLVLDEPEAHAFPPYTKRLAERIATDQNGNQFFLTTHSPYLLDSLLSKTPVDELNVVLCRMEDFETKAHVLNKAQIARLMEWSMDAFFNFDRLLEGE